MVSLCKQVSVTCDCDTDFDTILFLSSDHRECLELLLSYGAHIDLELPLMGTPLYCACMAGATACVEVLLHSGKMIMNVTERNLFK